VNASLPLVLAAILVSLVVVPAGLTYLFLARGPPSGDGLRTVTLGLVAMLPGVLMGSTALWVAARG